MADLLAELADLPHSVDPRVLRRKSRDFFWTSPVLKAKLRDCLADAVFMPGCEEDVLRIAAAAVRHRVPITARGSGTGNYGQAVPSQGGIVLEMTRLDRVGPVADGRVRAQAGVTMGALDRQLRRSGHELKHFPSTKRDATIGGYFAGGSAGVGAVAHGGLREPGNLTGARIVTLEAEPRAIDLGEADAAALLHSFGAVGLITEMEVPVTRAACWVGLALSFADLPSAVQFATRAARSGAVPLKLLSVLDRRLVALMRPLARQWERPGDVVLAMVEQADGAAFEAAAGLHGGVPVLRQIVAEAEADGAATPVYELSYGHASLLAQKSDPSLSYTQILCPLDQVQRAVALLEDRFAGHVLHHLEYMTFDGAMCCAFYPMLKGLSPDGVRTVGAVGAGFGLGMADPHVSTVEGGSGYKRLPIDLRAAKRRYDPFGLLNPGKL